MSGWGPPSGSLSSTRRIADDHLVGSVLFRLLTFMLTTVARYTACCLRGTQVKGLRLGSHLHCWTSEYCFSYQVTQASSAQWGDRRGPGLPHVRQFIYCRLGTLNAVQAE